jgi:hypothetical protein
MEAIERKNSGVIGPIITALLLLGFVLCSSVLRP